VLATREAVSRYRGDLADVLALRQARAGLPPAQVLVRRARPGRRLRGITTSALLLTSSADEPRQERTAGPRRAPAVARDLLHLPP
jgi:hypothetical protein